MTMRIHPIQVDYTGSGKGQRCGICGAPEPRNHADTPDHVAHLVHLVREHLDDVNRTFTPKGRAEEIDA